MCYGSVFQNYAHERIIVLELEPLLTYSYKFPHHIPSFLQFFVPKNEARDGMRGGGKERGQGKDNWSGRESWRTKHDKTNNRERKNGGNKRGAYQEEEAEWIIWIVHLLLRFPAILKTSLELGDWNVNEWLCLRGNVHIYTGKDGELRSE